MSEDFYVKRNNKNMDTIDRLLEELPAFCNDYFLGIDSQTSTLTRLNYRGKKLIKEISLDDLEQITSNDIEYFLSFLSHYHYCDKVHNCNDRAKARKLSSVRAMFKYFFNKGYISVNNAAKVSTPKLHEKPIIRLDSDEVFDIINTAESGYGLTPHQLS